LILLHQSVASSVSIDEALHRLLQPSRHDLPR